MRHGAPRRLVASAILLAGCASADKNLTIPSSSATATAASSSGSSGMAGHEHGIGLRQQLRQRVGQRGQGGANPGARHGVWQGMKISAEATTPLPFVIYNGTSEQMVKPGRRRAFT